MSPCVVHGLALSLLFSLATGAGPTSHGATTRSCSTQPTQAQKMWALATCGLLTESNQGRHDLLGSSEPTDENIRRRRESLAEWWGIHNHDELLAALDSLERGGHRERFNRMGAYLATLTEEQFEEARSKAKNNLQLANRLAVVRRHYVRLGRKSLIGWDYSRYVALCSWGTLVGYMKEDEAWQRIMPVARLLQRTFDSWEDLGENYLIGRQFWSYEQTMRKGKEFEDGFKKLLTDPSSPWVRYPWRTDLGTDSQASSAPATVPSGPSEPLR